MRQWKLLSEPLPFPWQWRSRKEKKNNNKGSILSSWLQRATAAQSRLLHGTPLLVPLDKTQLSPAFYPPAFPPTLLSISLSPPLIFNLIFPPFFFSSVHTSKMRLLSSDKHVGTTDWAHSVRALTFYLIESFSLTDQLKVFFFFDMLPVIFRNIPLYIFQETSVKYRGIVKVNGKMWTDAAECRKLVKSQDDRFCALGW